VEEPEAVLVLLALQVRLLLEVLVALVLFQRFLVHLSLALEEEAVVLI
tara:strand:- start:254 stop:397 length:144 start_codon:yes stop_codon:yes gene_type:complete